MDKFDTKKFFLHIGLGFLNAFVFMSSFFTMFSILVPVSVFFKYGRKLAYVNLCISSFIVYLLGGSNLFYLYFIFVFFIAGVLIEISININSFKKTYLNSLFFVFSTYFLGIVGFLIIKNKTYFSFFNNKLNELISVFKTQYPNMFNELILEYGVSRNEIINQFLINAPGTLIILISMYVLINLFLATRFKANFIKEISLYRISTFKVDYKFVWPALTSGAFFVLSKSPYISSMYFMLLANLIFSFFLLIYFFQGISVAIFYLNKYLKKLFFIQVFILVTIISTAFSFLSILGFFDVFFDFRKKISFKGGK